MRHPVDGSAVSMANLIVEWHPRRKERILLRRTTTPTLSRPRSRNPRGPFLGANDGASGVAVLMELGRKMPELQGKLGVTRSSSMARSWSSATGIRTFSVRSTLPRSMPRNRPGARPRISIAGACCSTWWAIPTCSSIEAQQHHWRDTPWLVKAIWDTAARLGVREFVPQNGTKCWTII